MKAKVTIEFDDAAGLGEKGIKFLLMDALYEFVSHRGPTAEAYVDKRYPNTPEYAWLNRAEKVRQVNQRIITAQSMHSCVEVTIEK